MAPGDKRRGSGRGCIDFLSFPWSILGSPGARADTLAIHAGQAYAAPLDYAPLPKAVVAMVEKTIQGLQVQGKPVSLAAAK